MRIVLFLSRYLQLCGELVLFFVVEGVLNATGHYPGPSRHPSIQRTLKPCQWLHGGDGMASLSALRWHVSSALGAPLLSMGIWLVWEEMGGDSWSQGRGMSLPLCFWSQRILVLAAILGCGCHSCGQKHHLDRHFSGVGL